MVLVCPSCSSRFKVKPEALGEKGRLVRCANCGNKWHASVDDLQESTAAKPKKAAKAAPKKAAPKKAAPKKAAAPKPEPVAKPADPPADVAPPDDVPPEEPTREEPTPEPEQEPDFAGEDALAHLDQDEEGVETEGDAPPPEDEYDGPPPPIPPASHFEPRQPATKSRGPLISWLALGGFIILFVGGLWLFAKPLVEAYPAAGKVFMAVGIQIDLLGHGFELPQPTAEAHPDKTPRTMVLKGVVVNTTGDTMTIPLLKGSLRDTDGMDLASWTFRASREEALPGESVPYETETSNLPPGATTVAVTFLTEDEAMKQGLLTEGDGE